MILRTQEFVQHSLGQKKVIYKTYVYAYKQACHKSEYFFYFYCLIFSVTLVVG